MKIRFNWWDDSGSEDWLRVEMPFAPRVGDFVDLQQALDPERHASEIERLKDPETEEKCERFWSCLKVDEVNILVGLDLVDCQLIFDDEKEARLIQAAHPDLWQ